MRHLWTFLRFWFDFLVGDAWDVAAGVVVMLVAFSVVANAEPAASTVLGPILAVGIAFLTWLSVQREAYGR
jgi:hypothetical protein